MSAAVEHFHGELVEHRAEWRAGFDAGVKAGANRYFQSTVMENIAIEITVLRIIVTGMQDAVRERDDMLGFYRCFYGRDYHDHLPDRSGR